MDALVVEHTVDGNSHDFSQYEAIGTDKGRHAVKRVQLEVVGLSLWWASVDKLDVEVIGFGDSKQNGAS